jgi:Erv1 / Alr family
MYPGFFTPLWDTMMIVARALPHDKLDESRKLAFIRFIEGLIPLIPCPGCSMHAMYYYMNHRLNDIQTGQEAYEWIIAFHNDVNKRNGKREYTVKEASEALDARLNGEMKDLVRSEVRQKEDHKKIKELSDELKIFRNIPHATTNEALFGYILAALIVGIVVLFLLIAFFAVTMRQFKHILSASTSTSPQKEEEPVLVTSE